jgi:hypothetical protein
VEILKLFEGFSAIYPLVNVLNLHTIDLDRN